MHDFHGSIKLKQNLHNNAIHELKTFQAAPIITCISFVDLQLPDLIDSEGFLVSPPLDDISISNLPPYVNNDQQPSHYYLIDIEALFHFIEPGN